MGLMLYFYLISELLFWPLRVAKHGKSARPDIRQAERFCFVIRVLSTTKRARWIRVKNTLNKGKTQKKV